MLHVTIHLRHQNIIYPQRGQISKDNFLRNLSWCYINPDDLKLIDLPSTIACEPKRRVVKLFSKNLPPLGYFAAVGTFEGQSRVKFGIVNTNNKYITQTGLTIFCCPHVRLFLNVFNTKCSKFLAVSFWTFHFTRKSSEKFLRFLFSASFVQLKCSCTTALGILRFSSLLTPSRSLYIDAAATALKWNRNDVCRHCEIKVFLIEKDFK